MKYIHAVDVEWGDCDPARIVFHPNFFSWMDAAAHKLFDAAGFSFQRFLQDYGVPGVPLAQVHADFRTPAVVGDKLAVTCHVSEFRTTSFTVTHVITRGDTLIAEGWQKRVWCEVDPDNLAKLKPAPIPAEFREALEG